MTGALKYEWIRITTIRSSYWMSAMALFFTVAISFVIAGFVSASDVSEMNIPQVTTYAVTGGVSGPIIPVMAAPFYAVMGAMAIGHEYRYGTNKATLTANPDRVAVLSAKLLVLLGWVFVVAAATLLVDLFVTWAFLDMANFESAIIRPMVNYVGYCLGFAVAGFALAAVFRNLTGAIVAVLTYPLVIEPIIYGVAVIVAQASSAGIGKITNLLPAAAGRRMLFDPYEIFAGFGSDIDVWGVGAASVTFYIGVAIVLVAGSAFFIRRDA